jgi:hypothetical protein
MCDANEYFQNCTIFQEKGKKKKREKEKEKGKEKERKKEHFFSRFREITPTKSIFSMCLSLTSYSNLKCSYFI